MDTEAYLTPGQVARRLRVDRSTVRRWIKTGALEAETVKQGKQSRFYVPRTAVEAIEQMSKHQALV